MMYVRRCTPCGIKYPAEPNFARCRVCDGPTSHLVGTPDADWEDKVATFVLREPPDVEDPVNRWRYQELRKAGFEPGTALELAENRSVDLRFVINRLVGRGCSLDLAYRIAS